MLPHGYDREALAGARTATYVLHQDVSYQYSRPVRDLQQRLVLLPKRRHLDQTRIADRFRTKVGDDSVVRRRTDRFDNCVVHVRIPEIAERVAFSVRAILQRSAVTNVVVPRFDRAGTTRLTSPDPSIAAAVDRFRGAGDVTETIDAVADLVHHSIAYCHDVTSVRTTAGEAWQFRRGVCQDMAHVMLAMCASLGIDARYVSGHLVGDGASHAWVEALDAQRGEVVAVDPTHNRRTDLRYVTTATGRDYGDVAPTSGTYTSVASIGTLDVRKTIRLIDVA